MGGDLEMPTPGALFDPRSNHLYLSVSLLQPHFPMLRCQFACCFSLWSAAFSMNLVCEMLRAWLLGVNSRVKCSHVLKYHGSRM